MGNGQLKPGQSHGATRHNIVPVLRSSSKMNDNNCLVTKRPQSQTARSFVFLWKSVSLLIRKNKKTTGEYDLVENNDGGKEIRSAGKSSLVSSAF